MSRRFKREPKAVTQTRHAITRARYRLKEDWTEDDVRVVVNKIRWTEKEKWAKYRGMAVYLFGQSHRVSIYAVRHNGLWVPVAYDKKRKTIATVLPLQFLIYDEDRRPIGYHLKGDSVTL